MRTLPIRLAPLIGILLLLSCVTTPPYDQTEYDRVITLKVDSLEVIQNATKDYSIYKNEVYSIKKQMMVVYEYAKNLPNNDESLNQIKKMNDTEGTLLGWALSEWESNGTLDEKYLSGLITNISDGFDQISGLISKRIKR